MRKNIVSIVFFALGTIAFLFAFYHAQNANNSYYKLTQKIYEEAYHDVTEELFKRTNPPTNLIVNLYKEGYIDCANDFHSGKMKVDLITNKDGSKEWKWIAEAKYDTCAKEIYNTKKYKLMFAPGYYPLIVNKSDLTKDLDALDINMISRMINGTSTTIRIYRNR
jgi:hypothetical protein